MLLKFFWKHFQCFLFTLYSGCYRRCIKLSERIILHSLYALNMLQIKCMYVHIKDVIKYEYIIQTARIMNRRRTFFCQKGCQSIRNGIQQNATKSRAARRFLFSSRCERALRYEACGTKTTVSKAFTAFIYDILTVLPFILLVFCLSPFFLV